MSIWRPHTTRIVVIGLMLILVAIVASYVVTNFQPTKEVRIGAGVFNVRVAQTEASRIQGLSGVEKLNSNEGLLMVFDRNDTHGIWMKDMKIPIDIVWMNSDKKVIYIVTDASPELGDSKTYKPKTAAKYVLEIPAGAAKKSAIKIGDTAVFDEVESGS